MNPKWFVVWTSNMSSRIIPAYIVSLKSSGRSRGCSKPTDAHKLTSLKFLSFLKLFSGIEKSLSSSKMHALETLYNQYKMGKISWEILIRHIRSIAGEKLLIATIKSLKGRLKY
ncbi:hypothetical protein KSP40_PGU014206 [Platanthera guangdongensis]|uniref:RST domain-containing protein n=1 Tax=Platanthera guangdongensis TaxID=2320717 RepID=A0ABR2MJX1_9ASPA